MAYKKISIWDAFKKEKEGLKLFKYPIEFENAEFIYIETEFGHESEFMHKTSTFNYYIIEWEWIYHLDDELVSVTKWDLISIEPGTRIWYEWNMKMLLLCNPPWIEENEVSFGVKNPHYQNNS